MKFQTCQGNSCWISARKSADVVLDRSLVDLQWTTWCNLVLLYHWVYNIGAHWLFQLLDAARSCQKLSEAARCWLGCSSFAVSDNCVFFFFFKSLVETWGDFLISRTCSLLLYRPQRFYVHVPALLHILWRHLKYLFIFFSYSTAFFVVLSPDLADLAHAFFPLPFTLMFYSVLSHAPTFFTRVPVSLVAFDVHQTSRWFFRLFGKI